MQVAQQDPYVSDEDLLAQVSDRTGVSTNDVRTFVESIGVPTVLQASEWPEEPYAWTEGSLSNAIALTSLVELPLVLPRLWRIARNHESDSAVRATAMRALFAYEHAEEDVVELLREAFKDSDGWVRMVAVDMAWRHYDKYPDLRDLVRAAVEDTDLGFAAVSRLRNDADTDPRTVAALMERLSWASTKSDLRVNLIKALGVCGPGYARVVPLIAWNAAFTNDYDVRTKAIETASELVTDADLDIYAEHMVWAIASDPYRAEGQRDVFLAVRRRLPLFLDALTHARSDTDWAWRPQALLLAAVLEPDDEALAGALATRVDETAPATRADFIEVLRPAARRLDGTPAGSVLQRLLEEHHHD